MGLGMDERILVSLFVLRIRDLFRGGLWFWIGALRFGVFLRGVPGGGRGSGNGNDLGEGVGRGRFGGSALDLGRGRACDYGK